MAKAERFPFKFQPGGGLAPNDGYVARRMVERGYKPGQVVMVEITKTRLPWYNRYAHKIGQLCVRNLEGFQNYDAHEALKRLQWESGAHCQEIGAMVPGVGMVPIRIPQSLAMGECSQEQYEKAMLIISRWVSEKYWPDMSPEQVQAMAETMVEE